MLAPVQKEVLVALMRYAEQPPSGRSRDELAMQESLARNYHLEPSWRELSKRLNTTSSGQHSTFFLGPFTETGMPHVLPLISPRWEASHGEGLKLRVGLHWTDGEGEVRCGGWRFERPSAEDYPSGATGKGATLQAVSNLGAHDFFHVQPITRWEKGIPGPELGVTLDGINESQPSFALDVGEHPYLPLTAAVSLYGLGTLEEMIKGHRPLQACLPKLERLRRSAEEAPPRWYVKLLEAAE